MKNWYASLSKTVRGILCISPLAVGGGLIILYALYEKLFILVIGIALVAISIFFLALNGKIVQEEKNNQIEKEFEREKAEAQEKGKSAAAKIPDSDLTEQISKNNFEFNRYQALIEKSNNIEERRKNILSSLYYGSLTLVLTERRDALNERDIELPLYTKAVGVTFENYQEYIKESNAGDVLLIKHSPSEQFPNSTEIINIRTNHSLGHIKSDLSDQLIAAFGKNFILNGEITEITGGTPDRPNFGCNIRILSISEEAKQ